MRYIIFAHIICALLIVPRALHAEDVTRADLDKARAFVQAVMHLKHLPIPRVNQDPTEYNKRMRGPASVAAFQNGVIYMATWFDPERDMPHLVHEVTHWAQFFMLMDNYKCEQQKEVQAYENQNAYAVKFGYSVRVDREYIDRQARCEGTDDYKRPLEK